MTNDRCQCGARLLSAEQVGELLNTGTGPLSAASARKAVARAGITEARGYSVEQVRAYAAGRPGKGRWGHK
jgi:hypothetical protein